MPQVQLPLFPEGTTAITAELAFERKKERVVYFNGHLPVFTHGAKDLASFRLFTSQLIVNGTASHGEIARAFGVPLRTVKRCTKRLREHGAEVFFKPLPKRRGHRLTAERLVEAQRKLEEGAGVAQISQELGVLQTTIHKALGDGRLKALKKSGSRAGEPGVGVHEEPAECSGRGGPAGRGDHAGGGTGSGITRSARIGCDSDGAGRRRSNGRGVVRTSSIG